MASEHWTSDTPISVPLPNDALDSMERISMDGFTFTPSGMDFDLNQVDYDEIFLGYVPIANDQRDMVNDPSAQQSDPPRDYSTLHIPEVPEPMLRPKAPTPEGYYPDIVSLGRYIEEHFPPAKCSEHPAFGGVAPIHPTGSAHYMNIAIDVNANWDGEGGVYRNEKALLDEVDKYARDHGFATLWQTVGHYDHLCITDWR